MDFFDAIDAKHREFIAAQAVFFVATAADRARINLSPKGMDCFRVLGTNRVAYLDFGGSGNETNAHLLADGRITVMFCAFDRPALILRLYGRGVAVLPQDPAWAGLAAHFTIEPGVRQIFDIAVDSLQTSCGWGVPFMQFEKERQTLRKYYAPRTAEANLAKWEGRPQSIDGLKTRPPSVTPAGAAG